MIGPELSGKRRQGASRGRNITLLDAVEWVHFHGSAWVAGRTWAAVVYPGATWHKHATCYRAWLRLRHKWQQSGLVVDVRRSEHSQYATCMVEARVIREMRFGPSAMRWVEQAKAMLDAEPGPAESDAEVWALFYAAEDARRAAAS